MKGLLTLPAIFSALGAKKVASAVIPEKVAEVALGEYQMLVEGVPYYDGSGIVRAFYNPTDFVPASMRKLNDQFLKEHGL